MTPEEARFYLDAYNLELNPTPETDVFRRALETIANMHTETDYRIVPFDQVNGRYETRQHTRHVTEWKEHP